MLFLQVKTFVATVIPCQILNVIIDEINGKEQTLQSYKLSNKKWQ
jgi:hypothetical protein